MPRNFLTGAELGAVELDALLDRALELKAAPLSSRALEGASVALIFEKPSTRTRLSFEVGIHELGGHAVVLRSDELQLSRGEAVRDTAIVLSRHVAAIGVRTGPDAMLEELAEHSTVPVINMLTALHHPCQALADLLTLREAHGSLQGLRVAYVGDGNNVARSLALLGALAGVHIAVASPEGYSLPRDLRLPSGAPGSLTLHTDPLEAVAGACAVYTDVWVSMGESEESWDHRVPLLTPYRVDAAMMSRTGNPKTQFLHCLPSIHDSTTTLGKKILNRYGLNGAEVSNEVFHSTASRVYDQAENRMHTIKAVMLSSLASMTQGDR